jgi:hypothetical protein
MMAERRQVWQYPIITEVISELVKSDIEDDEKYLIVGAGVILGSRRAYEEQNKEGRMGYDANGLVDQAEEAGIIAEEIKKMGDEMTRGTLEGVLRMRTVRKQRHRWDRPYWIIEEKQPYEEKSIRELGKYIALKFCGESRANTFQRLDWEDERLFLRRISMVQMKENDKLMNYLIEYFTPRGKR